MPKMPFYKGRDLVLQMRDPVFYDALRLFNVEEPEKYKKTPEDVVAMMKCMYYIENGFKDKFGIKPLTLNDIAIANQYIEWNW